MWANLVLANEGRKVERIVTQRSSLTVFTGAVILHAAKSLFVFPLKVQEFFTLPAVGLMAWTAITATSDVTFQIALNGKERFP